MGLFVNQHENHKEYTERRAQNGSYNNYGNYGYSNYSGSGSNNYAPMFINMGLSLFSLGKQKLDNDTTTTTPTPKSKSTDTQTSGASSNDGEQSSEEINNQINELKSQITAIFSEIDGAGDLGSLSNLIAQERSTLTTMQNDISGDKSPEKIQAKIDACYTDNTKSTLVEGITEADVSELEKALNNAKSIRDEQIPEQKLKIGQLEAYQGQIENINDQIDILEKKKQESSFEYSVTQEIDDIKNFMSALNEFKKKPTKDNAQKVVDAFENSNTDSNKGVNNKSVRQAWDLIEPKVSAVLQS